MTSKPKVMFPTKIKILDQIFKIYYSDKLSQIDGDGIKQAYGQTDFHSKTMRIFRPKDFSTAEVWNTIIHEAVHVIFETFKITEGDEKLSQEVYQEKVIHLLATGINTMMIDNNFYYQKINS